MAEHETEDHKTRFAQVFPTTILTCKFSDATTLNPALLAYVMELRDQDTGRRRSNQLGWQARMDFTQDVVARFCALVLQRAQDYGVSMGWRFREGMQLVVKECWANVNDKYAYNQPHTHPNALLSGAYYVQVPKNNSGQFILMDPRSQPWVMQPEFQEQLPGNSQIQQIPPEEGRLIMFPSWLEHSVGQNLSDGLRVSLSFNIDLLPDVLVSGQGRQ